MAALYGPGGGGIMFKYNGYTHSLPLALPFTFSCTRDPCLLDPIQSYIFVAVFLYFLLQASPAKEILKISIKSQHIYKIGRYL